MVDTKLKEYDFKLTEDEVNKVMGVLGQMPYIESAQLIEKFTKQYASQMPKKDKKGKVPNKNKKKGVKK